MTSSKSPGSTKVLTQRAQELLIAQMRSVWVATDRLFIAVLIVQWLAEITISLWSSPRAWIGTTSYLHPHVLDAVIWGGTVIALPIVLAIWQPGNVTTRLVIATSQAMSSALLIHLTDGRIETHFHVFASLALLAFYRDWRALALCTALVVTTHLAGGLWWPQSVYGTPVADPWRFAEHATWVIIEDIFLLIFCRQSISEMGQASERQARVEQMNLRIEEQVIARTEALKMREERFDLALKGSRVGICDWDLTTNHVYWSERINEILGLLPGELDETLDSGVQRLHPDDRDRVLKEIHESMHHGRSYRQEFRLRRKTGDYCWVEAQGGYILDREGNPYRYCGGLTDISDRKQMEADLAQRDAQLLQAQKLEAVGSLAGGIAHEFNNLLQAIRGYTSYAMQGLSPEDQRYQDLDQVLSASGRAATLTKQLLGFSRKHVLNRHDLNPESVVKDLLSMLRPLIGAHIEVVTHIDVDLGTISADPVLLQQMLLNLCVNARDAMSSGGRLTVSVKRTCLSPKYCEIHSIEKPGNYILFSVADNGTGIPPELQQRIFEPFFTTKEVGSGTGLGLSMVYGIVQQHQGCINVYSEVGIGTTFNVLLPAVPVPDLMDQAPVETDLPTGVETILIAEDESIIRNLTIRLLTQAGYTVLAASNGAEALDIFSEHAQEISLVILDAVMPELSGPEVYESLSALNPDLPVIFCTGYAPESGQLEFVLSEGAVLLQKPFDPYTLLRTVRTALDSILTTAGAP